MSGSEDNKFWNNFFRRQEIIFKFATAFLVIFFIAKPIGEMINTKVNADVITIILDKPVATKPIIDAIARPADKKGKNKKNNTARPAEKQEDAKASVNTPRLFAYGIQICGLVAALIASLLAIVALTRPE